MTEVYIVSGVRTAIGDFGGALKDLTPGDLAAKVARAALDRAGVAHDAVGHVVFGQVIPTEPRDAYLARVAGIGAGVPVEVPALTVNRLCGSGLQAVVSAAQGILLGDCDVAVAGGAESMSRAPYLLPDARWGSKMGDARVVDALNGTLSDPFDRSLMGVTAENVAERYGIGRDEQDALALESHRRAARAQAEGRFTEQILPVEVTVKRQTVSFATDEHVRPDITPGDLAKLRTVFRKDGTVTAGNASGINDGAAAVVLASGEAVRRLGLTPLARLVGYAHAGVEPAFMGLGPIPATRRLLARTGLSVADLAVIESNEAFAAQACAVARELGFDPDKVNPNGSGISLGHPVGATGAINLVKAVYELRRISGGRALVTMCIGGGQGIAALIESV
ncbi:beta-ketothiolase BktB [Nitrospirillum sp. BR 11828]|uniref:beta-ketothiolase BktB n=1 Tax=Nitrospirillum sp. BR 11828 TaxID=3104325 RepID=UPI002ACAB67E|nr:beta-ketothiolase BktB [Nitrospirillum sp. BR 11828]MDZ5649619.1 beta-ketothiolase BktB [Nitrospirillum sp. BR 11828]